MAKLCILLLAAGGVMAGQSLAFGVKGGVQLTSSFDGADANKDQRFIVGPTVEVGLPFGLVFEADALFRRIGYDKTYYIRYLFLVIPIKLRANSFEFPLLAKYYFGPKLLPVKLYADGGYVLRYVLASDNPYVMKVNPVNGVALGAGGRFRLGRFSVSPEIRYTHWVGTTFFQGDTRSLVQSSHNQADILIGFTF